MSKEILFKLNNNDVLITSENKIILFNDDTELIENLRKKKITVERERDEGEIIRYSDKSDKSDKSDNNKEDHKDLQELVEVNFYVYVSKSPHDNDEYLTRQYKYNNPNITKLTMSNNENFYLKIKDCIKYDDINKEHKEHKEQKEQKEQIGGTCNNILKQFIYPNQEFYNLLMNDEKINESNYERLVYYANQYLQQLDKTKEYLQNSKNIINFLIETQINDDNEEQHLYQFLEKFKKVFL
jgi:hypothetical protein